ncbi:MAG: cysteine desulfurase [Oscillospiraceae bacterium]|jgi:cysteine desulfurase|nr:cysteine desulfurase [Oscillospiraceae bacterium]
MIYLDYAATSLILPEARVAAISAMSDEYANASSLHLPGRNAKRIIEDARIAVAKAMGESGAKIGEVIFTSGGTESDNMAIFGAARLMEKRIGKHIVTTEVEHDAVRAPIKRLEQEGYSVTRIKPDKRGVITAAQIADACREDTCLVSVMSVCNETGNIYPISQAAAEIKRRKLPALIHTDAVQAFKSIPMSVKTSGADLISVSSHKIGGIKGVGALWIRLGLRLPPLILGGGQEREFRSGTEPVPIIAAFGKAAEFSASVSPGLKETLMGGLAELNAEILGSPDSPRITAFSVPGIPAEVLMNCLDAKGICISRGSACKRGRRSHVWDALGLPRSVYDSAVRVSFGFGSTIDDVRELIKQLGNAVKEIAHR